MPQSHVPTRPDYQTVPLPAKALITNPLQDGSIPLANAPGDSMASWDVNCEFLEAEITRPICSWGQNLDFGPCHRRIPIQLGAPVHAESCANHRSSQWKNRKGGFDHADRSVLAGENRVLDSIGSLYPILSTAESSACQVISASRKLSLFGLWNQVGHGEIPGQLQRDIWCLPYNKSQLGIFGWIFMITM